MEARVVRLRTCNRPRPLVSRPTLVSVRLANGFRFSALYTDVDTTASFTTFSPPVVDLSDILAGKEPSAETVRVVREACEHTGFFCVTGHSGTVAALEAVFAASRPFFDLPKERKLEYVVSDMRVGRGYEVSSEHAGYEQWVHAAAAADRHLAAALRRHPETSTREGLMSERFLCGPDVWPGGPGGEPACSPAGGGAAAARHTAAPSAVPAHQAEQDWHELAEVFFASNVWPDEAPLIRPCMESMYQRLTRVAEGLLKVFAVALELPSGFFDSKVDRHHSNMQVANYSSLLLQPDAEHSCMRKKAHADSGTLTLLTSDDWLSGSWRAGDGGLQLLSPEGAWQEVSVPRGALLVNLGNLMARWTNGRWKSTLHRVSNPARDAQRSRRMSLAYFHKANLDAVVNVVPSCRAAGSRLPPALAMHLTRQGILHKHRHLPPEQASEAYHAELAAMRRLGAAAS